MQGVIATTGPQIAVPFLTSASLLASRHGRAKTGPAREEHTPLPLPLTPTTWCTEAEPGQEVARTLASLWNGPS